MIWKDISYKRYNNKKMPTNSAVYRFYSKEESGNIELYVGQAKILCKRLYGHKGFLEKLFVQFGNNLRIAYHITDNLRAIEKEIIKKFKPKHNYTHNGNNFNGTSDIGKQVIKAMDGRKNRWLSMEVKIPENDLSKKLNGFMDFTDEEITAINTRLNSSIKK